MASDVERQIPVIRDSAGSGLTMEISREGSRQTATPFLTLNEPTVQRIEDRIAKQTAGLAAKEIPSGTTQECIPADRKPTFRRSPRRPRRSRSAACKGFLKGLRASRKEKPAPAVVVAVPEERLGRTDTSRATD